jgi:hypothetical protein
MLKQSITLSLFPQQLSSSKERDMDDFDEDLIWDTIRDNAKSRIDYERFAALFPINPDNFLSSILYGFAVGSSKEVIADKISTQVLMTCNTVNKQALLRFIEDNQSSLSHQIALTARALLLLEDGEEPEQVYQYVLDSLLQK